MLHGINYLRIAHGLQTIHGPYRAEHAWGR